MKSFKRKWFIPTKYLTFLDKQAGIVKDGDLLVKSLSGEFNLELLEAKKVYAYWLNTQGIRKYVRSY